MVRRQHGIVLVGLLAMMALGACWWLVSALANPVNRTVSDRAHNAKVLAEAKAALIGWVAIQTMTDNNPGRLPCPETPAQIGTLNEGLDPPRVGFPNCSGAPGPMVGRLPWKALGIDQLRDAAGEPLWYVVTTDWALQNSGATTTINSNSLGQVNLDGVVQSAVALIIAPGRPINVPASANCVARNQARPAPAPATLDVRNYLECQNAAGAVFVTSGPVDSFNDQVLAVTTNDVLPVIEAVVADRFARNVAPLLRSAYSNSDAANPNPNWPAAPRLPFAAAFPSPLTYKGVAARTQGMLPFTYGTDGAGGACNPADSRCDATFVTWRTAPAPTITAGGMVGGSQNCSATASTITCSFRSTYAIWLPASATYMITHTANNVGFSLRQFDTTVALGNTAAWAIASAPNLPTLNADGSATISVTGTTNPAGGGNLILAILEGLLCGLGGLGGLLFDCATHTVTVPIAIFADHPLILDSAANPQQWFVRNGWHQVAYYAIAPTMAPGAAGGCTSNSDCLRVTYHANDFRQRGVIAISGRSLNAQARPPTAVADLLEDTNANGDTTFTLRAPPLVINRQFNDRIGVIDLSP
jgi:hypothetical protein